MRITQSPDVRTFQTEAARRHKPRVLFVSNGNGEDAIAGRIIDHLRSTATFDLELDGWSLVGLGDAYRVRDVSIVGSSNVLPSEGFGTLSLPLLLRDLRAGWFRTHWRQWRAAVAMRGRYDLALAVGDVVPMLAARVAGTPFIFVGCAKSAYYGPGWGYSRLERALLRGSVGCFPRDALTAADLERKGVRCVFAGNPMMDGLASSDLQLRPLDGARVVACLPGSRSDCEINAAQILRLVADDANGWRERGAVEFVFALPARFDIERMIRSPVHRSGRGEPWLFVQEARRGGRSAQVTAELSPGIRARFVHGHFADVLRQARAAIGLAGTANEQAIGMGVPVVTFATGGPQGRAYLRMKMRFFGDSAIEVSPEPRVLRAALERVLHDDAVRAPMIAAGRERMGGPGATESIVRHLLAALSPSAVQAS